MFFPPPGGATEYIAYRSVRYMDFARATIPGISLSRALRSADYVAAKHTTFYKFEQGISFAEHFNLVAESSEFHLTLKRAHRVHFFNSKYAQKSGTF